MEPFMLDDATCYPGHLVMAMTACNADNARMMAAQHGTVLGRA
jgi:hypothetical protein